VNQLDTDPLLVDLYGAPLRPELWDKFLGQLTAMLGVSKAALIAHNLPKGEHKMLAVVGDSVKAGLHKRSAEDWGSPLSPRDRGSAPKHRVCQPFLIAKRTFIGWALRAGKAR